MRKKDIAEMYASFKIWYGFEKVSTEIEKADCIKCAIGKTLKELTDDDGETALYAKGYDHVIIPHTIVGLYEGPKTMLDNEIIVLPEAVDKIKIVDADTGIFHFSPADFDKFDVEHIGYGHGFSYAAGIYLTDTPIPDYGKKYNVDISALKKPYTLDIYDDKAVVDYLYACQ
jgi:hypothetical protein